MEAKETEMSLVDFVACVEEASEMVAPALGGKRYLSEIHAVIAEHRGLGWAEFAALATEAHQAGMIELSRADLVWDAAKTEASGIRCGSEEWHYLEG